MADTIAKEVQEVLTQKTEEIPFENIQNEHNSPLNQPVVEKDIGGEPPEENQEANKSWNVWKPENAEDSEITNTNTDFRKEAKASLEHEKVKEPLDAPEQEIGADGNVEHEINEEAVEEPQYEVPMTQANQAADALLGMTNNVIAFGGGFFVKIKKHEEFYQYEDIIEVIDQQNEKNQERILLDKDDKALLKPLLAQVLRKKAKKLTPEQQLFGAAASILLKKGQVVMEVRAENAQLEQRILTIVQQAKAPEKNEQDDAKSETDYEDTLQEETPVSDERKKPESKSDNSTDYHQDEVNEHEPEISIIEYAEEPKKE